MKQFIAKNKKYWMGMVACLLIGFVTLSFQDSPLIHLQQQQMGESDMMDLENMNDTIPPEKKMTEKDLDKLQVELDKAMQTVAEKLKEIDWNKLNLQISESLKDIDMDKIKTSVEQSLKAIDMAAIEKDVQNALKEVDMKQVSLEIKQAMLEAKQELEKINWSDIKKELADAKVEIEKAKVEMRDLDLNKIMNEAKAGIEKAKTEIKEMKTMITELEKDGLIDRKQGFKLEYKDDLLYIDGKQQSKAISDKYRKYAKDGKMNITIQKDNGKDVVEL